MLLLTLERDFHFMLFRPKPICECKGPLTKSLIAAGSIFLCATYGNLLLVGANFISDGSELLLEVNTACDLMNFATLYSDAQVMDPGLIGGLLLPVLGALPDSAMIIMSGMGGTVAEAQDQVLNPG
jgi:hypothetical protein